MLLYSNIIDDEMEFFTVTLDQYRPFIFISSLLCLINRDLYFLYN